jgi:hypothetical protein
MSEFTQAIWTGDKGLHVIKFPSGKFGFVGSVPVILAYIHEDGHTPTPSEFQDIVQSSFPAMTMKTYGIKTRVFETEQEARFTAARAGFAVENDFK